jgi:hypothetical protein
MFDPTCRAARLAVLFALGTSAALAADPPRLPAPMGASTIGTTKFVWTDRTRGSDEHGKPR